ncbi:MAG: hypothetical protein HEP71_10570 [Roseivirga sp.]|nr:hypothetical protein [Roseivirga sp.]
MNLTKINLVLLILSITAFASPLSTNAQDSSLITNFLADTKSLESVGPANPIILFTNLAPEVAAEQKELTSDNVQEILAEAKSFKHLVIIIGNHTIVKVTDLEDCRQSGSWGTCMPMGEGYIRRQGALEFQQDYLNNIIGIPGSQTRTVYFFN